MLASLSSFFGDRRAAPAPARPGAYRLTLFHSASCPACQAFMPEFERWRARHPDAPIRVVESRAFSPDAHAAIRTVPSLAVVDMAMRDFRTPPRPERQRADLERLLRIAREANRPSGGPSHSLSLLGSRRAAPRRRPAAAAATRKRPKKKPATAAAAAARRRKKN